MSDSSSSATANHVIAVTGFALEAKIAAGRGVLAVIGGGNAAALEISLSRELQAGACGVISFGVCGGLERGLAPGTCIVGREVIGSASRWSTDAAWSDAIAACVPSALRGPIAAVDAPGMSAAEKARLHAAKNAIAVDTESHVAAKLALQHRLPFAVFRVIADPAERNLPRAAAIALHSDGHAAGRVDVPAVLRSVLAAPAQIPSLIRLGLDTRVALRALAHSRRRLGAALGYPNLSELGFDVP